MSESTQFLMSHGDAVLFATVFAEQAGLPLPAAPWLLAAGALSAAGSLNPVLAVAIVALACVVPDWIWFMVGRRGGQRVLRWFCKMSLAPCACRGRSKDLFVRHGAEGLLAAKFIPALGGIMPPMAGALGVSTRRFLLFDGLGSLLYGGVYIAAGFLFHNQVQKLMSVLNELGIGLALAAVVVVGGYFAFKYVRRVWPTLPKTAASPDRVLAGELLPESYTELPGGGGLNLGERPGLAGAGEVRLALTSMDAHPDTAPVPSTLAQPTLCSL